MYDFLLFFGKVFKMQVISDIQDRVDNAANGFGMSIENLLQVGFNRFRKSPGIFIIYSILAFIVFSNPVSGLLLGGPIVAGYYLVIQRITENKDVEIGDFFRSFDRFLPLLILNLLISAVVFLGFLLLIIPGIYFAVSYLFSHFFVWFYDIEPSDAIRLSRKMVSGNFSQVFFLCLVLAGINLLGAMMFGVGLLITVPFSYCVIHAAFDDIIGIT
jgi:uncharacterized membrane protein